MWFTMIIFAYSNKYDETFTAYLRHNILRLQFIH